MIYIDTSALAKLFVAEAESESMRSYATAAMVTSAISAAELRRTVRRLAPERLADVESVLLKLTKVNVDTDLLRVASTVEPMTLRTLDAIHVATALYVRDEIEAFVTYDARLLEAARLAGIPTVSPGT